MRFLKRSYINCFYTLKRSVSWDGWTDTRKVRLKVRKPVNTCNHGSSLVHDAVSRDKIKTFEIYFGSRINKCFIRRFPSLLPFEWQSEWFVICCFSFNRAKEEFLVTHDMGKEIGFKGET